MIHYRRTSVADDYASALVVMAYQMLLQGFGTSTIPLKAEIPKGFPNMGVGSQ